MNYVTKLGKNRPDYQWLSRFILLCESHVIIIMLFKRWEALKKRVRNFLNCITQVMIVHLLSRKIEEKKIENIYDE